MIVTYIINLSRFIFWFNKRLDLNFNLMFCRNLGVSYFPSNFAHLCFLFLVKYFNNAVFDHDIAMSDNVKTSAANSEKQGCRVHEDCLCA